MPIPIYSRPHFSLCAGDLPCRDPRIRSLQATLKQLQYDQRAARSRFAPSIGATASYGTYYSSTSDEPFRTQIGENRNPSISLQLMAENLFRARWNLAAHRPNFLTPKLAA